MSQESAFVVDVTDSEFDQVVLEGSRKQPVVVDFWAEWCGPCRMLAPTLERLVTERQGEVLLAKVNVDVAPTSAQRLGVSSIPAVFAFREGQIVNHFVGVLSEEQLRAFLDSLKPSQAESLVHQADALDPDQAEPLYRNALAQDPRLDAARLGLARALLALDRYDEIDTILEPFGPEGEAGEEAARIKAVVHLKQKAAGLGTLAEIGQRHAGQPEAAQARLERGCRLAAEGQYAEALAELFAAGESDFKLAGGPVREAMVQIFYAVGVREPLADEYRRKLSTLLY